MSRLAAALIVAVLACPAFAADNETEDEKLVKRVNAAIEKGRRFLVQQQSPQGNWEGTLFTFFADQRGGETALVTLALLTSGTSPDDRVLARPLEFLRGLEPEATYVVGLTTMVLAEARQAKDLARVQKNVDWLLRTAHRENGKLLGWSYPRNRMTDASNTQYALLGLYAGKTAGAKIPESAWLEIREMYIRSQVTRESATTGYWQYVENFVNGRGSGPSLTMTVAGVCGLLIADMGLTASGQQLDEATGVAGRCGKYETNEAIQRGLNWVGGHFSLENGLNVKSKYYNIYGMERLGRLSGQRFIGSHDWYRTGCEYLVSQQQDAGNWANDRGILNESMTNIFTSFAVLFLSKGRTPVLVSKMAHGPFDARGGQLVEAGGEPGVVGWNRKHNDVRNLVEFASRELFDGKPMGWQAYDPRRKSHTPADIQYEVGSLLASPVVYLTGHDKPRMTGEQKQILKRYVEEGGFVLAEACCGSPAFADGFAELMADLFPENKLVDMPPEHPIWRAFFAVSPAEFKGVKCLERGCKTVVVFSPTPLAGYWEEARFMPKKGADAGNRGERAFRFAGNVIAYATGMQPPEQKGTVVRIVGNEKDASPPRGAFQPAQLRLRDEAPPAPAAMRNLLGFVRDRRQLESLRDGKMIAASDAELLKFKFVYVHGRRRLTLNSDEVMNLRINLESGGLLFADACCGKPEFDESFRKLVKELFPDSKLEAIPTDDELFSEKLLTTPIRTVRRREKAEGDGPDAGFRDLPPALEGIKIDGRWAVIYSKYDIGCALEGHKSTDCLGHTRESALRLGEAAILYALKR